MKRKIIGLVISYCLIMVVVSGCTINNEEHNDKETYKVENRTILVNWLTADIKLTKVRIYDFLSKKKVNNVNGAFYVVKGMESGFGEVEIANSGRRYLIKGELARKKVKIQYNKAGKCDTYKKK